MIESANIVQDWLYPCALFLMMMSIGLDLTTEDFQRLFKQPKVIGNGIAIQAFVFPLIAIPLLFLAPIPPTVAGGLAVLAATPSGGFSNLMTLIARANLALSVTLTTLSSLLALITMPILLAITQFKIGTGTDSFDMPVVTILGELIKLVLIPTLLGMVLRARFPTVVRSHREQIQWAAQIILYGIAIAIMFQRRDAVAAYTVASIPWALFLYITTTTLAFSAARWRGLEVSESITVSIEAAARSVGLATLVAATILNRPEFIVVTGVYFGVTLVIGLSLCFVLRHRTYLADRYPSLELLLR